LGERDPEHLLPQQKFLGATSLVTALDLHSIVSMRAHRPPVSPTFPQHRSWSPPAPAEPEMCPQLGQRGPRRAFEGRGRVRDSTESPFDLRKSRESVAMASRWVRCDGRACAGPQPLARPARHRPGAVRRKVASAHLGDGRWPAFTRPTLDRGPGRRSRCTKCAPEGDEPPRVANDRRYAYCTGWSRCSKAVPITRATAVAGPVPEVP
jgi:hypothetical protein